MLFGEPSLHSAVNLDKIRAYLLKKLYDGQTSMLYENHITKISVLQI